MKAASRLVLAALALTFAAVAGPVAAAEIESSIARGGRLYDRWWSENKAPKPDEAHPAYPANGKYAKQSWRCKECHGWDLKGKDGAYGSGTHATGIKGLTGAAGKDPAAIAAVIKDKTHGYTDAMLSAQDVTDLANFISKGQFDPARYIDAATSKPKGDPAKGEAYFNTLCAGCHGKDGKKVSTGVALGVAAENPLEMLWKAMHGQPGEAMPALRVLDASVAADVVAYTQSLPK